MVENSSQSDNRTRSGALAAAGLLAAGGAGAGALLTAVLAGPAGATTFTVTNLTDCSTAGCGSLRQAMTDAESGGDGSVIDFSPDLSGTITLTADLPALTVGVRIEGNASDDPNGLIRIDGTGAYHAFFIDGSSEQTVSFSNLWIANSVTSSRYGDSLASHQGGAIAIRDASLEIANCILTGNVANPDPTDPNLIGNGGAVFAALSPSVTITNSTFDGNAAVAPDESNATVGAIGAIATSISISDTTIANNTAKSVGAVGFMSDTDTTLRDVDIIDNAANYNSVGWIASGGSVSIERTRITGNTNLATSVLYTSANLVLVGGGRYDGSIAMTDSLFDGNSLSSDLGINAILQSADIRITRSTFTNNVAPGTPDDAHGALLLTGSGSIADSTVADNDGTGVLLATGAQAVGFTSMGPSSALMSLRPATPLAPTGNGAFSISHSTIARNSGHGIAPLSPLMAPNVVVDPPQDSVTASLDHALIADDGLVDVTVAGTARWSLLRSHDAAMIPGVGTIVGVDPRLGTLESASPLVKVVPIDDTSAAWNAGDPDFVPPPSTDQRGLPRVVDIIDIGAYEDQTPIVRPSFTG